MQVRIRTQQLAVPWNPENRQAFEQYGGNRWMLPVEVIGDYTTEGFFHKFNGVQNISSMALTLSGTPYVKSAFIVHVGGTRCVTFSTANNMKIHVRITLNVECIRTRIFLFLFYV